MRPRANGRAAVVGAGLACLLLAGCLGRDYLSASAWVSSWDHGWQVTVEPDEHFDVVLPVDRVHPDAPWELVALDPDVLVMDERESQRPTAEEPGLLSMEGFRLRALALGESALTFEARAGGETVALAEYVVAVVEDACAEATGITAPRCQNPMPTSGDRGWTEWDNGRMVRLERGADASFLTLTAPALYPDAEWHAIDVDPAVVSVGEPTVGDVRDPGDYDNKDTSKPSTFLAVWSFPVSGAALGSSPLRLEAIAGGQRVDVAEFTVEVLEQVEGGELVVQ